MIRLSGIRKSYPTRVGPVRVLDGVEFVVHRGESVGILGRNGAGKSTLIRLIGGAELPSEGVVERGMSVSWPLAFGGAFQGSLTGLDNLRFIARIYGVDPSKHEQFVADFSELGIYLNEPVKSYSSGMRARLAFAISMVIEFDCFLIDEIVAVGDANFRDKCMVELFQKRASRAKVIVSHQTHYIREHCTRAAVLSEGTLHNFESLDEAFAFYSEAPAPAMHAA